MVPGATNIPSCEPTPYSSTSNDSLIQLLASGYSSSTAPSSRADVLPSMPSSANTITNQDLGTILGAVIDIVEEDLFFPDDLFTTHSYCLQGGQHGGLRQ